MLETRMRSKGKPAPIND